VLEGGWVPEKNNFSEKMIGMTAIRERREIQWNRSQIMVPTGSKLFFFTLVELYSDLKNTVVMKCPNA
jgi:hypothetical protein